MSDEMTFRYVPHNHADWYEAFGWEIIEFRHSPHRENAVIAWKQEAEDEGA